LIEQFFFIEKLIFISFLLVFTHFKNRQCKMFVFLQVLSSILFYLVAHCMKRTTETVYFQSMIRDAYLKAQTIKEKVTIQKKNKLVG